MAQREHGDSRGESAYQGDVEVAEKTADEQGEQEGDDQRELWTQEDRQQHGGQGGGDEESGEVLGLDVGGDPRRRQSDDGQKQEQVGAVEDRPLPGGEVEPEDEEEKDGDHGGAQDLIQARCEVLFRHLREVLGECIEGLHVVGFDLGVLVDDHLVLQVAALDPGYAAPGLLPLLPGEGRVDDDVLGDEQSEQLVHGLGGAAGDQGGVVLDQGEEFPPSEGGGVCGGRRSGPPVRRGGPGG